MIDIKKPNNITQENIDKVEAYFSDIDCWWNKGNEIKPHPKVLDNIVWTKIDNFNMNWIDETTMSSVVPKQYSKRLIKIVDNSRYDRFKNWYYYPIREENNNANITITYELELWLTFMLDLGNGGFWGARLYSNISSTFENDNEFNSSLIDPKVNGVFNRNINGTFILENSTTNLNYNICYVIDCGQEYKILYLNTREVNTNANQYYFENDLIENLNKFFNNGKKIIGKFVLPTMWIKEDISQSNVRIDDRYYSYQWYSLGSGYDRQVDYLRFTAYQTSQQWSHINKTFTNNDLYFCEIPTWKLLFTWRLYFTNTFVISNGYEKIELNNELPFYIDQYKEWVFTSKGAYDTAFNTNQEMIKKMGNINAGMSFVSAGGSLLTSAAFTNAGLYGGATQGTSMGITGIASGIANIKRTKIQLENNRLNYEASLVEKQRTMNSRLTTNNSKALTALGDYDYPVYGTIYENNGEDWLNYYGYTREFYNLRKDFTDRNIDLSSSKNWIRFPESVKFILKLSCPRSIIPSVFDDIYTMLANGVVVLTYEQFKEYGGVY